MYSNYLPMKLYSDSATGGPVKRIPGVVDQWGRINIFYRNKGSEEFKRWFHALDTPKLQYIISKKGNRIKDAFHPLGVTFNLYTSQNDRAVHFIFNKDSKQDEIAQILKEKFEKEIVRGVESMAVNMSANMSEQVKGKLSNLCLEKDEHKAVYFDTKKGYLSCVADNDSHLNELLIDIGYEEKEKIRLTDISAQVLQDLQFEQAVKTSHPRLKCIAFDENGSFTLLWQGKKETSGSELLSNFKGKIRECVVLENAQNAIHIVFNTRTGARLNDTFVEYINEMTKQSLNYSALPLFTFDYSLKRITLYTMDIANVIQEVVNQSIIERQLDTETAKSFFKEGPSLAFCKKASDERKLVYCTKINRIVCIKSIEKELGDLINQARPYKEEPIDLADFHVSFLKQYGSQLLEQVEKRYDIAVKLGANRYFLLGKDSQLLQKGKEFIKENLKKRLTHMSTCTSDGAVLKLKAEMEKIAAENNCTWKLNYTDEFNNTELNKYVGAWYDPLGHILTCVQDVDNGDLVAADLVIEMTTNNLFPLSKAFEEGNNATLLKSESKFVLGHGKTMEGPFQSDVLCCKIIYAVVIYSSSQETEEYITSSKLKQCFSRALRYADHNGMESIALSTKLLFDIPVENDITTAILEAAFENVDFCHEQSLKKVILCCINGNSDDICSVVEKRHATRKGYRRIFGLPMEPSTQNSPIKLNVKVGSITDSKRDVIVTTVDAKLNFTKGQVSKMILERAGPEMEAECMQKYPYGIAHDQIAYTKSHRMGDSGYVNYLFYGALPFYSFNAYEKTVKSFVKRCLYLADRLDCKTLVFPTIGVGNLGYPRRETAAAMFEAIEEYPKEAANSGIQEVDIMAFDGDHKSCMIFRTEEWRKSKEGTQLRHKLAETIDVKPVPCQKLVKNIGEDTKVKIARVGACRQPTFAVEIVMRVGSIGIKPASAHPQSWNDQIDVCSECAGIANIDIEKLGSILLDERITEVFFFADKKDKLPFSEQVIMLEKLIQQLDKNTKKPSYLKTCTIFVDDQVEDVVLVSDEGWKWTECAEESNISIELLGQTEECVERARISIESLLNKTKEEEFSRQEERMMGVVDNVNRHLGSERLLDDQDSESAESENETEEIGVSAVINKGIIALHEPKLKEWLLSMKQKFNLNIKQKRKDVSVSGTIASVLEFENYLKTCVRDYAKGDQNVYPQTVVYMDEVSYSLLSGIGAFSRYADLPGVKGWTYDVAQGLVITCKEKHWGNVRTHITEDLNKMKRECIVFENVQKANEAKKNLEKTNFTEDGVIVCNNSEITIGSFDYDILRECFDRMLPMMLNTRRIRIDNVELKFLVGDIRNGKVEFIAISSSAKMTGRKGAGKLLANMLGKDFLESCEKSLKENGDIQESECRVIRSGLAYRRFIGHVRLPVNENKQKTQRIQHNRLEESILNCFKRAVEMRCTSIALPCLGSEENKGGFDLKNCANDYVHAFNKLQPSNLKEICFVDLNADKINTVFETFFGTLGRQHQLQKESTV